VSTLEYPVVRVPGGHLTPIVAKRGGPQGQSTLQVGRTYIRRVGPASEEPQSPEEWRALLDRCVRAGREDLIDRIRLIVAGDPFEAITAAAAEPFDQWIEASQARWKSLIGTLPANHPARFQRGYYQFAYQLRGEFAKPSLVDLRRALMDAEVRHSGWPNWPVIERDPIRPTPINDTIECFMGRDDDSASLAPDRLDYWRVSTGGRAFTVRGFSEDSHPDLVQPGAGLDITTPTWRLADAATHAVNLARALNLNESLVDFDVFYTGLEGRKLVSIGNPRRFLSGTRRTLQNQYQRRVSFDITTAPDQLPEIVDTVLRPLYQSFDFFDLPAALAAQEIAQWRRQ
jgi:hypothetical protein